MSDALEDLKAYEKEIVNNAKAKTAPIWRTGYETEEEKEFFGQMAAHVPEGESLTQQSYADDADLNVMMARMGVTEKDTIPVVPIDLESHAPLSTIPDLRTTLDARNSIWEHFQQMPAKLRGMFDHDPLKMWEYVNNPANHKEAVALGILAETTVPAEGAPPASTDTKPQG